MRYYRIPLNTDLSLTSCRDSKLSETNKYIEYNEGFVGEDWEEITENELISEFGYNPFLVIEQTQLDIIQESVSSNENSQLTIMEALAEQYEENLEKDLNNMEVQATIYETILELGGVQ